MEPQATSSSAVLGTAGNLVQLIESVDAARGPRPIHVGGCPRSGTTLLAAMLGVGPQHLTVPEARFKWPLLGAVDEEIDRLPLAEALRLVQSDWKFGHWRVEIRGESLPDQPVTFQSFLRSLVLLHGESVGKNAPAVWIDHTPANARYAISLDRHLEHAKFVHVVRDGRGVAASIMPLDWGPNHIFEAAYYWSQQLASGLAAVSALGPAKASGIRYEDLTCRPEDSLKSLCRELEIDYRQDMVTEREYPILPYTQGQHRLVGTRPDCSRATAWRTKLGSREVETFEYLTADLLRCLGYELEFGLRARPPRRIRQAAEESAGAIRRQLNKIRKLTRRQRFGAVPQ